MPRVNWRKVIPGYADAIDNETSSRDLAFLEDRETIAGVEVRSMTLPDFLRLAGIGSPYLCGGNPTAVDDVLFLWVLSPGYERTLTLSATIGERAGVRCRTWFLNRSRLRFQKRIKSIRGTGQAIEDYLDTTFMDWPEGKGHRVANTSLAASMVAQIAMRFGWSERDILKLPLKRMIQYHREIQMHDNPKVTFINPSDKLRGRYLGERNAQLIKN